MKTPGLVTITKTYDLMLWSCNHTNRFSRQYRFVFGERFESQPVRSAGDADSGQREQAALFKRSGSRQSGIGGTPDCHAAATAQR